MNMWLSGWLKYRTATSAVIALLLVLATASQALAIAPSRPRNVSASDGVYQDRVDVYWHWGQVMPTGTNFWLFRSETDYVDCSNAFPIVAQGAFSSHTADFAHLIDTTAVPGRRYKYAVRSIHLDPLWPDPGLYCSVSSDNPTGSDFGSGQLGVAPTPSASSGSSYSITTLWPDQPQFPILRWRLWRSSNNTPCTGTVVYESATRNERSFDDTTAPVAQYSFYSLQAIDMNNAPGLCSTAAAQGYRNGPPSITSNPSDVSRFPGQVATFRVTASGVQLGYQWQQLIGGTWSDVSGGTGPNFSLTAQPELSGRQYRARVWNGAGLVFSSAATLTVYGAPTITQHPANASAFVGQPVSFSSGASGQSVQYLWQSLAPGSSVWINFGPAFPSAFTPTLTYDGVWIELNGYRFRMCASNPAGSACSNAATLTVTDGPTITQQPSNATVYAGQPVSFTSAASGPNLTYSWQYRLQGTTTWVPYGSSMPSAFTTTFTYASTWVELNGLALRMCASNPGGTACSNSATLTVNGPPTITLQPSNATAFVGQPASFSSGASGQGVQYLWQSLAPGSSVWINFGPAFPSASTPTFTYSSVWIELNGYRYRMCASNPAGQACSNAATLTVNGPPTITTNPQSTTVQELQTAVFSCAASGQQISFSWIRNGNVLPGESSAQLTLPNVRLSDNAAVFRCRATNPAGSVESASATLTVTALPTPTPTATVPPPTGPECSDGLDNDGDGRIDYPADPGCTSGQDDDEHNPLVQCDDGVDNDLDGPIDMQDPDCTDPTDPTEGPMPEGCTAVNVTVAKIDSILGPGELEAYALRSLAKLVKASKKADRKLGRRLARSAKKSSVKMHQYLNESTVALLNLPDVILSCPGVQSCVTVDNAPMINSYLSAIRRLRNQATHSLNRATRLVYTDIEVARRKTSVFGRKLRQLGRELQAKANALPRSLSVCA